MNKLAVAVQGDGANRPERPQTNDSTRPKAQSHIRQSRSTAPQAEIPKTGPMAAMLKKIFGKE
jgi:PTH1 family peptidyl-tRNA hydrolase